MNDSEKIRWAPKMRREKIIALYNSDASQLGLDEELLIEVGYALLARCRSIQMIQNGQIDCPRCGHTFQAFVMREPNAAGLEILCPADCGWSTALAAYQNSYRHRELWAGKAGPAFEQYLAAFPLASTPEAKMYCIDRLLHAFHWDLASRLPNRSAANNLIEGSMEQVLSMLDQLTFGNDKQAKDAWRATVQKMIARRRRQIS
jgi:hypothetical protein